jgi:FdhE protein
MTVKGAVADPTAIGNVVQPPFVRLPDLTTLFERRADRLRSLAAANDIGDFLSFIEALTRAQAEAAKQLPAGTLPGAADIAFCHDNKLPLIDRLTWRRDPSWLSALDSVLDGIGRTAMPDAARAALDGLRFMDSAGREACADRVLGVDPAAAEPALACFAGAALQVYWARMAALLEPAAVKAVESPVACPVCGSPPLISLVYAEGNLQAVRFLCCPLCASQWYYVRIKCANCTSTKGIAYQHLAETSAAIKAETCDECGTYTKIAFMDKEPGTEPFADDLATLALDILVGEAGWARATPNPFLLPAAG